MITSQPILILLVSILERVDSQGYYQVAMKEVSNSNGPLGVSKLLRQVIEQHLSGCHLLLMSSNPKSLLFRDLFGVDSWGAVTADNSLDQDVQHLPPKLLKGGSLTTCRGLLIHLDSNNTNTNSTLSLVEQIGLLKMSWARVLVVGGKPMVESVLLHHILRNTIDALYFAVAEDFTSTASRSIAVYRRCMYCNKGQAGVQYIGIWHPKSDHQFQISFPDQFHNLHGHRLKVVAVSYFPYVDFVKHRNEPGSTVTLRDSLDDRLIATFSAKLNFTYEIRAEPERNWGLGNNGVYNGMMGQLQREEVDFCTAAAPTPGRLKVNMYARAYSSDIMTITSLKPTLLPQHLALVRPFSKVVWLSLLLGVVGWGATLWGLQKVFAWVVDGRRYNVKFSSTLLFGWGALLDQSTPEPSISISGQMLVGWWLVFCLIISTGFRSALIAHLTVQGSNPPLETLADLVQQSNWQWGTEERLYKGAVIEYFTKHTDPVVQEVEAEQEILDSETALKKVKEGGYSLLCFKNYIDVIVATRHTDARGRSPFYISPKGIAVLASLGWGFRKGAPFFNRFMELLHRMDEAGLTPYWNNDVVAKRVKEDREGIQFAAQDDPSSSMGDSREVVLSLNHLQGAFYLLFLGCGLASLLLLGENLAHSTDG